MSDSDITIYHNPTCGTSRNTLAMLRKSGIEPRIVEYLKTPPTREVLRQLIEQMGVPVRAIIRQKGTPYFELGLDDPSLTNDQLLDAMVAHPILINRPIVITPKGAKLCRPSDVVLDLLATSPHEDFDKEEGSPFLIDKPIGASAEFIEALQAEGLPTDDLDEPAKSFFRYTTLSGSPVGFGGFERYGPDALLRSIVVAPEARGRGIGRNLVLLLSRRAHESGAETAYVLTTDATSFFEAQGFKPISRSDAPASILATRQLVSLCPASATLLARQLTF
ncbi:arsenate reductase (glutaredoxin) [Microvirga puerhi]|uniref:Arsenate reductase n=1 Tax=Microvirga puerhi TaxID=2876078 RepID=A0ABS7VLU5_9HYPH|nr:arsenate reductase (glutaredoxin) [Microvirga puerhi]MBZ6076120.1 arsenate reductase (glutaredoxin) [Microvirga puerhi]